MLYGSQVSDLLADIDRYKLVSVVGYRGVGKDLLVSELSSMILDRKTYPPMRFYSNQFHLWNDEIETTDRELFLLYNPRLRPYIEANSFVNYPMCRNLVADLTEAGRFIRKFEYFQDLLEYARKFNQLFFFPTVREPHAALMTMTIYPGKFQLQGIVPGVVGGRWYWKIQDGYTTEKIGKFFYVSNSRHIGIYDTEDPAETPDRLLSVIRRHIEIENYARGRNGIQAVEGASDYDGAEELALIQSRISAAHKTLLNPKQNY